MNEIYLQLREEARKIVATLPLPKFYQHFAKEISYSRQTLNSHPVLIRIKQEITSLIEDDFGHGILHSDLVCVDAGAIVQIEMQQDIDENLTSRIENQILLVQTAGLLHDIKRKEKEHSAEGAKFTREFLSNGRYPFTSDEIDIVCNAIIEHEAFQNKGKNSVSSDLNIKESGAADISGRLSSSNNSSCGLSSGGLINQQKRSFLISNSLYDADKFRWGTDNFTHTVWDMVIFANVPLSEFIRRYPAGMATLEQIKSTFRTDTGKLYGPDFIDLGIETGNRLLKTIKTLNIITKK
ncbi:MAG: HD domain-containing protein [Desulfamplus sp.]|nr:HD domain-containing protein [Desulfamplus sp.]